MRSTGQASGPLTILTAILLATGALAFVCDADQQQAGDPTESPQRSGAAAPLDLMAMFPPAEALPVDGLIAVRSNSGSLTNTVVADETVAQGDTSEDLRDRGRTRGYRVAYAPAEGILDRDPYFGGLVLRVDEFEDDAFAIAWLSEELDATLAYYANPSNVPDAFQAEEKLFLTGVTEDGDDTRAVQFLVGVPGDLVAIWVVTFRVDNMVTTVALRRTDAYDAVFDVADIARLVRERVSRVSDGYGVGELVTFSEPDSGGRGGLGLRCSYASKFLRDRYSLPVGPGCVILRVMADSNVERAGLRIGDKIVEMDGVPITSGRQFSFWFLRQPSSARIRTLTIQREAQTLTIRVELGGESDDPRHDPYPNYLAGRGNLDPEAAVRYFTLAIEEEPDFDLAYVYRGAEYARLYADGKPTLELAERDLAHALALDPDLPEAHEEYARLAAYVQQDFDGAMLHIDRALAVGGCERTLEVWDVDCGQFFISRAVIQLLRGAQGDLDAAAADLARVEPVSGTEQQRQAVARGVQGGRFVHALRNATCTSGGLEVPCKTIDLDDPAAIANNNSDILKKAQRAVDDDPSSARAYFELSGALAGTENPDWSQMITLVETAMQLANCVGDSRSWAHECGEYVLGRARLLQIRNGPGDLDLSGEDIRAVAIMGGYEVEVDTHRQFLEDVRSARP